MGVSFKFTCYIFRKFCDELVRPEDSEIFAYVSCITSLEDSPLACLMDPEDFDIEDDIDRLNLSHEEQRTEAQTRNVQVRASTSMDSLRSYEEIKAEKHFVTPLNIRHLNKVPFSRLLRVGTNVCCHFHEAIK